MVLFKKSLAFLVGIFVFYVSFNLVSGYNCVDSDNKDYNSQGFVSYLDNSEYFVDYCKSSEVVNEYYCKNGVAFIDSQICQNGCFAGKCLDEQNAYLSDERHFNACFDSDLGVNYDSRGIISSAGVISKMDYCLNSDYLNEYSCSLGIVINSEYKFCQYGCLEGICNPEPEKVLECVDSDGGIEPNKNGSVIYQESLFQDSCYDELNLQEFFCSEDSISAKSLNCENGCFEGACLPGPINKCLDTDNGKDFFSKGILSFSGSDFEDVCLGSNRISEYYCDVGLPKKISSDCIFGCENGKCVESAPKIISSVDKDKLWGWYSFDEDSKIFKGFDSSKNLNFLSSNGSVEIVVDDGNPAVWFRGGYLEFPERIFSSYPLKDNLDKKEFSFSLWFKSDWEGVLLSQISSDLSNGLPPNVPYGGAVPAIYIDKEGKLRVSLFYDGVSFGQESNKYVSEDSVDDNQWHHILITYGNGTEIVYLDGSKKNVREFSQKGYSNNYKYLLGTGYANSWEGIPTYINWDKWFTYFGRMDKIAVYERVLSDKDAKNLYLEGRESVISSEKPKEDKPVPEPEVVPTSGNSGSGTLGSGGGRVTFSNSGSGVYSAKMYVINDTQLENGYIQSLRANDLVKFKIKNESIYLKVLSLSSNAVLFEINSTPSSFSLGVNESKLFEFNNDEFYDLKLEVKLINSNVAQVSLNSIHELKLGKLVIPKEVDVEKKEGIFSRFLNLLKDFFINPFDGSPRKV
ncbi:hypothetical protein COU54_00560 [Candidatus Pacearchaeota archaeon CG10_big_fil_rev_8_21_14_0_10_31_24]|nr:MAG: hypothetical protein COU54_00560 [Candidatus Pacearchaeota archaeon CG10_big_fil_rev_8_21_14_0_10_31_24]